MILFFMKNYYEKFFKQKNSLNFFKSREFFKIYLVNCSKTHI
ncbi:hypothetical protein HMPREF0078_1287 [Anaerococcus vaginalis ATCC 51170]|uniref:Uncharacterized protein n=1 Tax=Anaerococcus vaginalis ATCC 51170 TaxID=655811 RepID=C7HVI6_9FIRM|nr:hypothetical protein HMPREF0078_1287 [Anaerococcus vaginalis ATCC 51170]